MEISWVQLVGESTLSTIAPEVLPEDEVALDELPEPSVELLEIPELLELLVAPEVTVPAMPVVPVLSEPPVPAAGELEHQGASPNPKIN